MYRVIRSFLFLFSAERAHNIVASLLKFSRLLPFSNKIINALYSYNSPKLERELFGLKFSNPVGLAAGFDKNGELYNQLGALGFGFVEIGSLTPKPQPGNPKPRNFRVAKDRAIINRMGINNHGIDYAVDKLANRKKNSTLIVGANIIKGSNTPNSEAALDYERSFSQLYDFVDYFVINVSCPNVKDLTTLQEIESLAEIVERITTLRRYYDLYKPVLLKVSPDLSTNQLDEILDLIEASGIDGIVATNTTISRDNLTIDQEEIEAIGDGGLSGAPLYQKSLAMVKYISQKSKGRLPIVAVGGIMSPLQAKEMLDAGASLIQVYSGFIYNGPKFVKRILKYIDKH